MMIANTGVWGESARQIARGLVCFTALISLLAMSTAVQSQQEIAVAPDVRIQPGYTLAVTVDGEEQLSGDRIVAPSGTVHFAMYPDNPKLRHEWDVVVAGKTASEAGEAVVQGLKTYLKRPQAVVKITGIPQLEVDIRGAADRPGRLQLKPGSHLSDAMVASGYKQDADLQHIAVIRAGAASSGERVLHVDFAAFLRGDTDIDPPLIRGDAVVIPLGTVAARPSDARPVRVVGEVLNEVTLPLAETFTINDALARAGGMKPTADVEHVRVIRGEDGKVEQVDATRPGEVTPGIAPLRPGDLVIVGVRDQTQAYAVLGAVAEQKTVPMATGARVTVLQAIKAAGGPAKTADPHRAVLRRGYLKNPAGSRDIAFDPQKIAEHKQTDFEILPGDAIVLMPRQHRASFWQQLAPALLHFLPFGL